MVDVDLAVAIAITVAVAFADVTLFGNGNGNGMYLTFGVRNLFGVKKILETNAQDIFIPRDSLIYFKEGLTIMDQKIDGIQFRRTYKVKSPHMTFYCPLCRTQRGLRYSARLSKRQYLQIISISIVAMMAFFRLMGERVFIFPVLVWSSFECINKLLFRREVSCPHCGFDATWYKRDVRVAKKLVKDFWEKKNQTPLAHDNASKEDQTAVEAQ